MSMSMRVWAATALAALLGCGSPPGNASTRQRSSGGGDHGTPGTTGTSGTTGTTGTTGGGVTTAPFTLDVVFQDPTHRILAVDRSGVAYATDGGDGGSLLASEDGRTWQLRSRRPDGAPYTVGTALASGTLLADAIRGDGNVISRSADGGRTWTDVLPLGGYRMLTPHSVAELDGEVFLLEYQSLTLDNARIHLWVSDDDGRTWQARAVFTDHRHGHGLHADPATGALWLFFGDLTGGAYLSLDHGATATEMRTALDGGSLVDAVSKDGGILAGMDALYQPLFPHVVAIDPAAEYRQVAALPGPSYSIHAVTGGGYVVGAAREAGGDVYGDGPAAAHLLTSPDGVQFTDALQFPWLGGASAGRADVYWELPTGELVLELRDVAGFPDTGYALAAVLR